MKMLAKLKYTLPLFLWLALFSMSAHAELTNTGVLDSILSRYQTAASGWAGIIINAASWLFWTLALISMTWTFGLMALRKADIGEFFSEFIRFTIFTGFFWWLLTNGPYFASTIYESLRKLAANVSGLNNGISPSGMVDIGFELFERVLENSSIWKPVDSLVGFILAIGILVILALVSINMLLLLISGWVLAYGGVFFLGFGGSRWTSDMAINYYKTVLGVAVQLMGMVLLVGIGKTFLDDYYALMSTNGIALKEMAVMLIVVIILLLLTNKIPGMFASMITGASVSSPSFGAGSALAAASMAAAAMATGGAAIAAGASQIAGGAQAIKAAFSKASENASASGNSGDIMSGGDGGSGSDSNGSSTGDTPFAQAAGFDSSGGGGGGNSSESSSSSDSGSKSESSSEADSNSSSGGSESSSSSDTSSGSGSSDSEANSDSNNSSNDSAPSNKSSNSDNDKSQTKASNGFLSKASKVGRITADAGGILAKGAATVAKNRANRIKESAKNRISNTVGGKIAAAIKVQDTKPTFDTNSLASGETKVDRESEVASFVNRDKGEKSV